MFTLLFHHILQHQCTGSAFGEFLFWFYESRLPGAGRVVWISVSRLISILTVHGDCRKQIRSDFVRRNHRSAKTRIRKGRYLLCGLKFITVSEMRAIPLRGDAVFHPIR